MLHISQIIFRSGSDQILFKKPQCVLFSLEVPLSLSKLAVHCTVDSVGYGCQIWANQHDIILLVKKGLYHISQNYIQFWV